MYVLGTTQSPRITINIHQWENNQASIRFIRYRDTLISLDFDVERNTVYLNSYISGKPLSEPPKINVYVASITFLTLDYQSRTHILQITMNGCSDSGNWSKNKKIRIKDFEYQQVIGIDLRASLTDSSIAESRLQKTVDQFAEECVHLPEFQEVSEALDTQQINNRDISEAFNRAKKTQVASRDTQIQEMQDNTTQQLYRNKPKINVPKKTSPKKPKDGKINLYQRSNPQSVFCLQANGLLENTDWEGTWYTGGKHLFIFTGNGPSRQHLQLHYGNGFLRDTNGHTWLMSSEQDKEETVSPLEILQQKKRDHKMIVLIITCYKRQGMARQARNTWVRDLQEIGITCFFVVGSPTRDFSATEGDLLVVPCPDNYESLPAKVYLAMKHCYHNYQFSHLFKVDDDTLVNPVALVSINLTGLDYVGRGKPVGQDFNRFWHRGKCEAKIQNQIAYPAARIHYGTVYAKGEVGYFVSRRAVSKLLPQEKYIVTDLYEDKVIGDCLRRANINLTEVKGFTSKLYESFPPGKSIDQWTVIVDARDHQIELYQRNLAKKVQYLN